MKALLATAHRWIGVGLGVWFCLICVSGSLVVFEEELDALLNPGFFAVETCAAPPPLDHLLAALRERHPALEPRRVMFRHRPQGPLLVSLDDPTRRGWIEPEWQAAVDPCSGRIAIRSAANLVHLTWYFHVALLLQGPGSTALGISGIVLLATIVSGLVLWWPKRGKLVAAVTVKRPARGHRLNVDLHRVVGFWLLVPFALATVTGVVLIWPNEIFSVIRPFVSWPPPFPRTPPPARSPGEIGLDAAVNAARTLQGDRILSYVVLPAEPRAPYLVVFRARPNGHPRGRDILAVDRATGVIVAQTTTNAQSFAYRLRMEWLVPLHSGDILGIPGKIVMLVAGLAPVPLTVTGLLIWIRKRRPRQRTAQNAHAPAGAHSREVVENDAACTSNHGRAHRLVGGNRPCRAGAAGRAQQARGP